VSSEVEYLQLTSGKGLTWKKQLDKVTNKALHSLLDLQRHVQENLGTETKGDALDIHHV
jgi:hypothetical protein